MIHLKMMRHRLLRYLGITVGCLIASCSINLFLVPSHLLTGGATGIAIIVYYLAQLPIGLQTFLYNIPLLMAAWKTLGHGYTVDVIIGTGINCSQQPEDFPPELRSTAGSLAMALGRSVDRPELAAQMLASFARMDAALYSGKERMLSRYRQDCITLGKEVSLVRGAEIRHGTALDIGPQGDLIVRFRDTGEVAPVSSGEVSVRGLYGYV